MRVYAGTADAGQQATPGKLFAVRPRAPYTESAPHFSATGSQLMELKVIGAGAAAGTLSLYTALNQLGFPCYHMFEVLENKANKSHLDFWLKVAGSKAGGNTTGNRYLPTTRQPSTALPVACGGSCYAPTQMPKSS